MASLWAKYLAERERKEVLEMEHGFAVFCFPSADVCYLEHLFVDPDFRIKGLGTSLGNRVSDIAMERGASWLVGSVSMDDPQRDDNLKHLLHYGMGLDRIDEKERLIYLRKALAKKTLPLIEHGGPG